MMGWDYSYNGEKTIRQELEDRDYKYEFTYGSGGGYDWSDTEVWTKDGRVFTLRDSGCSCSSFGDAWGSADSAIGEMEEVTTLPSLKELEDEHYYSYDVDEIQGRFRELGLR